MTLEMWLAKNNIQPEDLDEVVHDAAASMASNSNNEGLMGQISFLRTIAGWSDEDIKEVLS
tara:strand:- start:7654 stop:7836 length:183 start_codon:yes stop_codon:yes gene_type:complete